MEITIRMFAPAVKITVCVGQEILHKISEYTANEGLALKML